MQSLAHQPTFVTFAICSLLMSAQLLALWAYSGFVRTKTKKVVNAEDVRFSKTASVDPVDPPEVARVLRAHANAMAVTVPFFMMGLLYALLEGPEGRAKIVFPVFVLARFAHAFFYLHGIQPWRTITFATSALMTGVLIISNIVLLAR